MKTACSEFRAQLSPAFIWLLTVFSSKPSVFGERMFYSVCWSPLLTWSYLQFCKALETVNPQESLWRENRLWFFKSITHVLTRLSHITLAMWYCKTAGLNHLFSSLWSLEYGAMAGLSLLLLIITSGSYTQCVLKHFTACGCICDVEI